MTRDVVSIGIDHSVQHAAQVMLANQIGGLPVLNDEQELVGILTQGDLVRRLELYGLPIRADVEEPNDNDVESCFKTVSWRAVDYMSTTLVTVNENASINRIAALMAANGIKHVPVVRGKNIAGIVTCSDLLGSIVDVGIDRTFLSDQAIKTGVLARLKFDLALSLDDVDVTVSDGQLHLLGTVESLGKSRAATAAAKSVSGVCGVQNGLSIRAKSAA